MQVVPYPKQSKSKKEQIAEMFDAISLRYDVLNRLLSARLDLRWRRQALRMLLPYAPQRILDVATGTADFALEAAAKLPQSHICGVDISEGMLSIGRKKVQKAGLKTRITLKNADAEALPFAENDFDAAIVAFGVRNFENPAQGLSELYRVLQPGATLLVLEFSTPRFLLLRTVFRFYFHYILPLIGRWLSGQGAAYTYLPRSVAHFPEGNNFIALLKSASFTKVIWKKLSLGIASVYMAQK